MGFNTERKALMPLALQMLCSILRNNKYERIHLLRKKNEKSYENIEHSHMSETGSYQLGEWITTAALISNKMQALHAVVHTDTAANTISTRKPKSTYVHTYI